MSFHGYTIPAAPVLYRFDFARSTIGDVRQLVVIDAEVDRRPLPVLVVGDSDVQLPRHVVLDLLAVFADLADLDSLEVARELEARRVRSDVDR